MAATILEFDITGMKNGGKIPVENTGRGQDISPEFVLKKSGKPYSSNGQYPEQVRII